MSFLAADKSTFFAGVSREGTGAANVNGTGNATAGVGDGTCTPLLIVAPSIK